MECRNLGKFSGLLFGELGRVKHKLVRAVSKFKIGASATGTARRIYYTKNRSRTTQDTNHRLYGAIHHHSFALCRSFFQNLINLSKSHHSWLLVAPSGVLIRTFRSLGSMFESAPSLLLLATQNLTWNGMNDWIHSFVRFDSIRIHSTDSTSTILHYCVPRKRALTSFSSPLSLANTIDQSLEGL